MSNQRPTTLEEGNYDPSTQTFNFKQYLPQSMGFQNLQGNMSDTGRFTPAATQQQETFRNAAQSIGNLPGLDMNKQMGAGFNQGLLGQFSGLPGQPKTLDANLIGRIPQKDLTLNMQTGLTNDQTSNQFVKNPSQFDQFSLQTPLLQNNLALNQQQLLQLELLKMQQTPSSQNLLLQNQLQGTPNPSLFGAGFLNAAQLLASAQQLSQPQQIPQQQPQQQTLSMADKSPQQNTIGQSGPNGLNSNVNFLNNLNSIYQNLNHYQTLIDSIEKQGSTNGAQNLGVQQNYTAAGQANFSQTKTPLSQQTQSYLNSTNYQAPPTVSNFGYPQADPIQQYQQNTIGMPLQQNLLKQNNYMENNIDPNNQSMNGYLTSMLGNENNEPLTSKGYSGNQPFNYEQKSLSRERQYNPQQYQQYGQNVNLQNPNNRSFSSDYNYAKTISQAQQQIKNQQQPTDNSNVGVAWLSSGGPSATKKVVDEHMDYKQTEHYIQRSPPKSQAKGRENQSPSASLYKNQYEDPNESLNYLKFSNQNKAIKISNTNSPSNRQINQRNYMGSNYDQHNEFGGAGSSDLLQQSFRNQNHNNSHGSNSILQEQHLNTYQKNSNTHHSNNQYSPAGSNYKNNDYYGENPAHQNSYSMRSNRVLNIDDMPIHAPKARNFEELLESNLRQMGIDPLPLEENQNDAYGGDKPKPKREFLKRKSKKPEVQAPSQAKKYNYYVDNFEGDADNKKKDKNPQHEKEPVRTTTKSSTHNVVDHDEKPIGGGSSKHHDRHETATTRNSHHEQSQQKRSNHFNRNNTHNDIDDNGMTERQVDSNTRDQTKPAQKKKFLARGSGTAGGRKGYDKSKTRQSQEEQYKEEIKDVNPKNRTAKFGQNKKTPNPLSDEDNQDYYSHGQQQMQQDTKSPRPQNSNKNQTPFSSNNTNTNSNNLLQQPPQVQSHMTRNSIMEFEKLEKECIDKYSPSPNNNAGGGDTYKKKPTQTAQQQQQQNLGQNNKRKKKLFDDSDSDDNNDQHEKIDKSTHNNNNDDESERLAQYQSGNDIIQQSTNHNNNGNMYGGAGVQEEAPKSNLVKKFFMKEESKLPGIKQSNTSLQSNSMQMNASSMAEEIERQVNLRLESANKLLDQYKQDHENQKRKASEYERLIARAQVEKREFETLKKKAFEEIERLKQDELEKLKKEKKALEQRSKNLQLVGNSNKKEREEIDGLKRELTRVTEEAKAKEQKQKMTIDRLKKQVDDLTQRNKELSDELRHHEQQRLQQNINVGGVVNKQSSQLKQPSNVNTSQQQQQQQRYTFSTQGSTGNINDLQQQQQQQQQPKGILKNKHESQKNVRTVSDVSPGTDYQDQDYETYRDDQQQQHDYDGDTGLVEEDKYQNNDGDYCDGNGVDENRAYQQRQQNRQQIEEVKQQQQQQQQPVYNNTNNNMNQVSSQPLTDAAGPAEAEEEEEEDYDMKFPLQYHNKSPANTNLTDQIVGNDGKMQRQYQNGKKEVIFSNGVRREVFPDGYTIVYFNNNDIKQTYPDSKVVYYFADAKTTQTTFPDGLQVFKFANNQVEKHFPDGTKEIIFPDGTIKCIFADGEEESIFPDGIIQRIEKNGVKAIEFANGQKDILFPDGTRIREFPDGRVKKTYPDGTIENTYRN